MTKLRSILLVASLGLILQIPVLSAVAMEGSGQETAHPEDSNRKLAEELRRIQREIAALRADLDKPGLHDVFAGLGYILGLFGTAAFVASRRKKG